MTYSLLIGDRSYSSWSLRGWLLFAKFDVPVTVQDTRLYEDKFREDLKAYAPARTVPSVRTATGGILSDSLALAETLAEIYPDKHYWPTDPNDRALARSMAAEMHSSYTALRGAHPMNLRESFEDVPVTEAVQADLTRIEQLWTLAKSRANGPWLFGEYSAVDAMFAPVATRIATYGLPAGDIAQAYIETTISDPTFLEWRRRGLQDAPQSAYEQPYKSLPWPGPD
jgi:glutathione S-transferase